MIEATQLYTREEIYANRLKWIEFLLVPGRKKAISVLDEGNGYRCCLGHACFVLKLTRTKNVHLDGNFYYDNEGEVAPSKLIEMVGLWDENGTSDNRVPLIGQENNLASLNDETDATPKEIGEYLMTVIEGGIDTPFRPLSHYN